MYEIQITKQIFIFFFNLYVLLVHNFVFELEKLHMLAPIEVGREALPVDILNAEDENV